MKNVSLVLFILALSAPAFGQFEKGRILVGGSGSLSYQNLKDVGIKSTSFSLLPNVGYFVADRIVVGSEIGFSANTTRFDDNGKQIKTNSNSVSLAPFVRYYFEPGVFLSGAYGLYANRYQSYNGTTVTTNKSDDSFVRFGVGYAYFLNNHVAIEPTLGYIVNSVGSNNSYGLLSLSIGFQIYLGGN